MSSNYKVGYGKPPKQHRFKKGQSGNPTGRPKGTRNLKTDLTEELAERIVVKEGDKAITVSKQRALIKRLTAKALQGDTRAATLLLNMVWRILDATPAEESAVDLQQEDLEILEAVARGQHRSQGEEPADGDE